MLCFLSFGLTKDGLKFGLTNRRRSHCRKCGRVVCKECSLGREVLAAGGGFTKDGEPLREQCSSKVRVCIKCQGTISDDDGAAHTGPVVGRHIRLGDTLQFNWSASAPPVDIVWKQGVLLQERRVAFTYFTCQVLGTRDTVTLWAQIKLLAELEKAAAVDGISAQLLVTSRLQYAGHDIKFVVYNDKSDRMFLGEPCPQDAFS